MNKGRIFSYNSIFLCHRRGDSSIIAKIKSEKEIISNDNNNVIDL